MYTMSEFRPKSLFACNESLRQYLYTGLVLYFVVEFAHLLKTVMLSREGLLILSEIQCVCWSQGQKCQATCHRFLRMHLRCSPVARSPFYIWETKPRKVGSEHAAAAYWGENVNRTSSREGTSGTSKGWSNQGNRVWMDAIRGECVVCASCHFIKRQKPCRVRSLFSCSLVLILDSGHGGGH